ncbi:restriction endonuclease subunit S [Rhodococcus sp. 14-2470-1a]|uniref:restriction endonuclease subunit S n=1 Tax=Rhodococcus sp. 14-2470-1a TaxID=2023150 RepID=UPI000B9C0C71|nr:restriction endonuclease subunit S [Rhodococcus sp. 14-2470-1a]OZF50197.1 hypothetical protein CH292_14140 [Rhodococcus sp. 14-2470-1a]
MTNSMVRFEELFAAPLKNGVSYPSRLRGSGIPMVNMGEFFSNDRITEDDYELAPLTPAEKSTSLLAVGDLLFARQSLSFEGAGRCAIVGPATYERTWESHLIRVRLNSEIASPLYYFYYFRSLVGRRAIETIIQQVAAAGIRGSDLKNLKVPCPPLTEQQSIAAILGQLDKKIELNASLLEKADSLIRLEFERTCTGQTDNTTVPLGDLVLNIREAVNPRDLKKESLYIGLEHLPRRLVWLPRTGLASSVTSMKLGFRANDILFGKLRPYFHKVATTSAEGVCSTDILVLRPRDHDLAGFALAALSNDLVIAHATSTSEGTRMPRAKWDDLEHFRVPWPGLDQARSFSQLAQGITEYVHSLTAESALLADLRDLVLQELFAGRLQVSEAGQEVRLVFDLIDS